jgi:hypothetical protein
VIISEIRKVKIYINKIKCTDRYLIEKKKSAQYTRIGARYKEIYCARYTAIYYTRYMEIGARYTEI